MFYDISYLHKFIQLVKHKSIYKKLLLILKCFCLGECVFNFDSKISLEGNFSSPDWPNKYPHGIRCIYNFNGQQFQAVNLKFSVFDLESPFSKGYHLEQQFNCEYALTFVIK